MGPKKAQDARSVRAKHEEAIAALVRQRDALRDEIAHLERKRRETADAVVRTVLDLIALQDTLDQIDGDAEWVRRKAAIRSILRERAGRKAPSPARLENTGLPPALDKQLHELVDRIQGDNAYAHVSGDFSDKTALQNLLLARHADRVAVRWDGDNLILIEYEGRSAGHLPIEKLSREARSAVADRLGLSRRG